MTEIHCHDAAVIGAGPAGLVASLALAHLGLDVAILAPAAPGADPRTTALLGGSVDLLHTLGCSDVLVRAGEPLTGIRIVDDRGGLLRAPDVLFRATEIEAAQFGINIANTDLVAAIWSRVRATPSITRTIGAAVASYNITPSAVTATTADGRSIRARFVVGADGRNSSARAAAGLGATSWSYPQSALVTTFMHARSHDGISTEFHRTAGPLTTVPLHTAPLHKNQRSFASSLVWVDEPAIVVSIAALDDAAFLAALDARLHGLLGTLSHPTPRVSFPLAGLTADRIAANRIALVGEAAHVIPPIGAQGLNLGLRDAASLADCVEDALAAGEDLGGVAMLDRYRAARGPDIAARVNAVDLLNRSLLSDFLPLQAARGIGLHLLANTASLRKAAMRGGLEPVGARPRLMRPDPARTA